MLEDNKNNLKNKSKKSFESVLSDNNFDKDNSVSDNNYDEQEKARENERKIIEHSGIKHANIIAICLMYVFVGVGVFITILIIYKIIEIVFFNGTLDNGLSILSSFFFGIVGSALGGPIFNKIMNFFK